MVCGVVVGCSLVVLYNSLVKLYKTAHSCVLKWLLGVGGGAAPLTQELLCLGGACAAKAYGSHFVCVFVCLCVCSKRICFFRGLWAKVSISTAIIPRFLTLKFTDL